MGDVNFILEDVIDALVDKNKCNARDVFSFFYTHLLKFPKAREVYEDGSHPVAKINNKILKPNSKFKKLQLNKEEKAQIKKLFKHYIKKHDLQYYEVFGMLKFYLDCHRPDLGKINFFYGVP